MEKGETLELIRKEKAIAIVRMRDPSLLIAAGEVLIEGGINILEYSLNSEGALDAIRAITAGWKGICVGAGTILTAEEADASIRAGASFLVSPSFREEVVEVARKWGVATIPGGLTPSEIYHAYRNGGDMVKVFPAEPLGPSYIKSILNPFPGIPLVPTGGIGIHNARAYLLSGAVAVAVGGQLVDEAALREGRTEEMRERVKDLLRVIRSKGGS